VGLDPALADAVVDWIDPDSDVTQPAGAEDPQYLRADIPYRAANRPFVSASELLLVQGFTAEAYKTLQPFVAALPVRTTINVNTAPKEVLMALADNINENDAQQLIDGRGDKGYDSLNVFVQHKVLAGRGVTEEGLSVATDFFLLDAATKFDRAQTHLYSLLARGNTGVNVVYRGQGAF